MKMKMTMCCSRFPLPLRNPVRITRRHLLLITSVPVLSFTSPKRAFATETLQSEYEEADLEELRPVQLFENSTRSVVSIQDLEFLKTTRARTVEQEDAEFAEVQGVGSGFVWDRFGHIITNYHVVSKVALDTSNKQRIKVSLVGVNGEVSSYNARIVGLDPSRDLAVLKIDIPEPGALLPAVIGSSKDLKVGQNCYAIGNPYGYEHTLTTGVVSGLGRQIPSPIGKPIFGAIQTDASINAGNSGGPLLDSFGRVIGVNTATFTRRGSGMSSGVNFAIAIDLVRQVAPQLIVEGSVTSSRAVERAVLGPPRYSSIP